MPIIRSKHSFDEHFTQIPNAWLRDTRLSLKAIGLLGQLMSHSVGWNVSMRSLAQANNCGVESIRSAVQELEICGYLIRVQERETSGRFGETTWQTCDPGPIYPDSPSSDSPSSENPSSVKPSSDNRYTKKNISKNTKNSEEQSKELMFIRDLFEEFYSVYPRRQAKPKAWESFLAAYEILGSADVILDGARRYANDPNRVDAFTALPATWLNQERWNDDPLPERILTSAELKQKEEAEAIRRKEREMIQRQREQAEREREREEMERNLRENPVERCVHDRVKVICQICG